MSKRKPATASKHARNPKIAAKAQRTTQAIVRSPKVALQEDFKKTMTANSLSKGFDLSSATAIVRAYQANLLEMAQANMTFAFEFSQRLATIRSPLEFLNVIAEFTSKRIAMFGKYSKEMAEVSAKGGSLRDKATYLQCRLRPFASVLALPT